MVKIPNVDMRSFIMNCFKGKFRAVVFVFCVFLFHSALAQMKEMKKVPTNRPELSHFHPEDVNDVENHSKIICSGPENSSTVCVKAKSVCESIYFNCVISNIYLASNDPVRKAMETCDYVFNEGMYQELRNLVTMACQNQECQTGK